MTAKEIADLFRDGWKRMAEPAIKALADRVSEVEKREPVNGRDGVDGKDGAPGKDGIDGKDGAPGADGKDGKDGAPGRDGINGEKGIDGKDGRDGRDGEDGRDASQVEVLDGIDVTRSYPRNTWAAHRGGLIRSYRVTDKLNGELEKAGWHVVLNGIAEESEEVEGRTIKRTTVYTNGQKFQREIVTKAMEYRQVWKDGQTYQGGDVVTWAGSGWHCEVEKTTAKPGTGDDWRLMVKAGRDGKDASSTAKR